MPEHAATPLAARTSTTIGVAMVIGDPTSQIGELDDAKNAIETGVVATASTSLAKRFGREESTRTELAKARSSDILIATPTPLINHLRRS